jgi:flagellar hook protein FlgE
MGNFSIALSGLEADSIALNTIGNNLANLNTTAYKGQTTSFEDLFHQTLGESGAGDPIQVGSGTKVDSTTTDFSEGTLLPDANGNTGDMALDGSGFFLVEQDGQQSLTRAGNFTVANNGSLTTQDGQFVLGYPATDGVVNTNTTPHPITLPIGATEGAQATQNISVTVNLDSEAAVGTTFTTPVTVYDSLGQSHQATITYDKTATNIWTYSIALPPGEATGPEPTTGSLSFDTSGNLIPPMTASWHFFMPVSVGDAFIDANGDKEEVTSISGTGTTGSTVPAWGTTQGATTIDNPGPNQVVWTNIGPPSFVPSISFTGLADGASDLTFDWNLDGVGTSSLITQFASANSNGPTAQDGFTSGNYTGFTVDPSGLIQAEFSNGNKQTIGQVAVANVANVQGLVSVGGNNFRTTASSGQAVAGVAGTGGRGLVDDATLEQSNVNIATEFSNLIIAQRAFEANSKTVTTFDTISQDALAMVR